MTVALVPFVTPAVEFPIGETAIAEVREKYGALTADTADGYEQVRLAIAHLRGTRGEIEKCRAHLKEDSLAWGRKVDGTAKKLTALISEIEEPLKAKRDAVDKAKEIAKRAAEETERLEREAAAKIERELEEKRIATEREKLRAEQAVFAEATRKADEDRATREAAEKTERDRVAAEQRAAQEKIDAGRAEVEAKQAELDRAEKARLDRIEDEKRETERVERERIEAIAKAERETAEAVRLEALRPEIERLKSFGLRIRELRSEAPTFISADAVEAINWVTKRLLAIADAIDRFPGGSV